MGARSISTEAHALSCYFRTTVDGDRRKALVQIDECCNLHYRGREHYRRESVYLARVTDTAPTLLPRHTANEKAGLIEHRWWTVQELAACHDKLLPPNLPTLLADI
jgi:hypothetical protein